MLKIDYIKRIFSGFLLVVFALGITPKRILHSIFSKHIDSRHKKNSDKPYQLNNAAYTCDNDNLVAESSFVSDQQLFSIEVFNDFPVYICHAVSFSSTFSIYSRLRGPPADRV